MNRLLAMSLGLLFFVAAPILLSTRARFPRQLPWWLVLLGVAVIGWMLLVAAQHFATLADMECPPASIDPNAPVCVGVLVDYAESHNSRFGWLKSLVYFALWLPIYGLFISRRRRAQGGGSRPNKSLERTRGR
jgi:hypothetical protein